MMEQGTSANDFNGLAANYGRFRIGYSGELFDALQGLGVRRGSHVLDVGCGTGISMQPLVARGVRVTGLDPSTEMLAAGKLAVPAATFVLGNAEALPFADGSFDAAVSAQAFHWFDADAAFAELIRVVRPGGPIAVWWKILGTSDPMRAVRAAACARVGVQPPADLKGGFSAFYRAPLTDRKLRVLPFSARFGIEEWIGYERSRASARNAFGPKLDAYLDALRGELLAKHGSQARVEVRYTQYLYVGSASGT
jgi:ubiquinone/menaquinone biosynthesis C-methylase UbiE